MTIGELARKAGVSVRAIRHYEVAGLLRPAGRQANGYRFYDGASLDRLGTIRSLRQLGLSLAEIGRYLDQPREQWVHLLRQHRRRVDAEIERLRRLQHQLRRWEQRLGLDSAPNELDLQHILEVHMALERHFSQSTLTESQKRHDRAGQEHQREARTRLEQLVAASQGAELRRLVAEFMGEEGAETAFGSDEALAGLLRHHGLDVSPVTVKALRRDSR